MIRRLLAALAMVMATAAPAAQAHKASDAYLTLRVTADQVDARIDVALRDLDRDLDLDANADDRLSWREVRTRWSDIAALARDGLVLTADGVACMPDPATAPSPPDAAPALAEHSDGRYAVVRLAWRCGAPVNRLDVDYRLFGRTDPTHRGIVRYARDDQPLKLLVLSPGAGRVALRLPAPRTALIAEAQSPAAAAAPLAITVLPAAAPAQRAPRGEDARDDDASPGAFAGFAREGVHHILIGYDHILFLLSLLLPSVWLRQRDVDPKSGAARARWVPASNLRPALASVFKVVTAFTVAHSITLALSVLDIVDPPLRWVESTIAASVVLAALNNVWPVIAEARWKLTFVFGLVHGFGFASALKDAGLARGDLAAPLLGFNLGVEIGQLCIVALVLPLAWTLRDTRTYRGAFAAGSLAIAGVAALWLVQRAFDLSLIAG
ncbi:MAG: HupE/UreJ family protein [Burkholderiaceae bacterium]